VYRQADLLGQFFLCSFSEDGNEFGQWRAYGDDGRGFAIGFDAEALRQRFSDQMGGEICDAATFPVEYCEKKLGSAQLELVDIFEGVLKSIEVAKLDGESAGNIRWMFSSAVVGHAINISTFFKHPAYRSEKEYRLLATFGTDHSPDIKLRPKPYHLTKYIEIDWGKNVEGVMKEIWIGPSLDADRSLLFANECLKHYHSLGKVKVTMSGIPYRSV
jgi:Protein of unknown function (DUF2971)